MPGWVLERAFVGWSRRTSVWREREERGLRWGRQSVGGAWCGLDASSDHSSPSSKPDESQTLAHDLRHLLTRAALERELGASEELAETLAQAQRLCARGTAAAASTLDLRELLAEELRAAQRIAPGRRLVARLDTSCELCADAVSLRRIVANLLANSLRATPVGAELELALEREGSSVVVRIRDAGRGMAPDEVDRLLSTGSSGSAGTGTGTLAVAECARRVRADLVVCSGPGLGTQIELRLRA